MTYVFEIPNFQPTRLNEVIGRNRFVVARRKRQDAEFYRCYSAVASVPKATGKRRVKVTIFKPNRRHRIDADAIDKLLLDGLKRCGLIVDDSPEWLAGRVEVVQEVGERATVIELEDVC